MRERRRVAAASCALALLALAPATAVAKDRVFQFQDDRIIESSGLAASARHEGIVYTHNDSDAGPVIYAVDDATGQTVAALTLQGAPARDWEAMAPCRHDEENVLWVGDIGDNIDAWKTYRLLRVPEPKVLVDAAVPWAQYDMRYADGQARDAEALLCHPTTGRLFVVSKENKETAAIYRGPKTLRRGAVNTFTRVAAAPEAVTDGAFLAEGRLAVLRGYFRADIVSPATKWTSVARFTPPVQIQGESVAEAADGTSMLFGSEGLGSTVWSVPIPDEVYAIPNLGFSADDVEDKAAQAKRQGKKAKRKAGEVNEKAGEAADRVRDTAERVNNDGIPGVDGQMVALVSALGLGAVVLVLATRRD